MQKTKSLLIIVLFSLLLIACSEPSNTENKALRSKDVPTYDTDYNLDANDEFAGRRERIKNFDTEKKSEVKKKKKVIEEDSEEQEEYVPSFLQ